MASLLRLIVYVSLCILALCLPVHVSFDSNHICNTTNDAFCNKKVQNNSFTDTKVFPTNISCSVTDTSIIFLSKELPPLVVFSDKRYGLGLSGFLYTRSSSLLIATCMTCLKCISHYLSVWFFRCNQWHLRNRASHSSARKIRLHLAVSKRRILVHITATTILLLLLCGDVHTNPGPVLPGTTRHPDRQMLVVGSWNVRTLLETKRTPIRPTAVVARELDRSGM